MELIRLLVGEAEKKNSFIKNKNCLHTTNGIMNIIESVKPPSLLHSLAHSLMPLKSILFLYKISGFIVFDRMYVCVTCVASSSLFRS